MSTDNAARADASMPPPKENLIRAVMPGVEVVRDENGAGMPTLTGEFAVFDQWTEINSVFEGQFMERFAPGSMRKTIRENKDRMRVLFQHGMDPQVGDKPLGPIASLKETSTGARYEVPMLDTAYNRDLIPGLEAGLYGASFRFRVEKEEFVQKPKRSKHNPNGLPERTVTEASVKEFGPVTFPAYQGATAGIRSLTDEFLFGRFIDDPDRLKELIEAHTQRREPEASEPTTRTEEPDSPESTTPPEREVIRVPEATKPEARKEQTMTVDERRARLDEIVARKKEIHAEFGADALPDDIQTEWDSLNEERTEHDRAITSYEARVADLDEASKDERRTERPVERKAPATNVSRRIPANPWAIEEYRTHARSLDELPELYNEGARTVLETAVFDHPDAKREEGQEHIEKLLQRDHDGELAKLMITTGSPTYRRAFTKTLMGQALNGEEQRAMSLTTTAGGFAVPYQLDPTVLPTSNGTVNPIRQISRVEQVTSNEWRGVSSAGVTASFGAEGSEAGDNAPTLAQPTAFPEKATVNIPYSIELGQDWGSLQTEMARMIQDAKDQLEATKYISGVGHASNEPEGLLVGGTAVVSTAGATVLAVADLYSLETTLPPRFRPRASIIGNKQWFNRVRQLDTTGGALLWARLAEGTRRGYLDYPAYEAAEYSSAITTGASVLTIGDFSYFLIADRIGLTVETIPHLFHTSNNRPSGQRSIYAYWRTTSKVLAWQAFRTLKVT
jgi:HK97 family phage major capsid protein/HK97 family phage prohead protease